MTTSVAARSIPWEPTARSLPKLPTLRENWGTAISASTLVVEAIDNLLLAIESKRANARWTDRLAQLAEEIGTLAVGWAGEDSVAPGEAAIRQLRDVSTPLSETLEPQIEIDPSDGDISLIWSAQNVSVALVLAGRREVAFVRTRLDDPVASPVTRITFDATRPALFERQVRDLVKDEAFHTALFGK